MQALNSLPIVSTDCQFSSTNLEQIIDHYESIVNNGDTSSHNYWYLGLAYLLQEREIDAQATWFIPFEEASELESVTLTSELSDVLDRSAAQELAAQNLDHAWLISQYLREVNPAHLNNLFRSILLEIKLERFSPDLLAEWAINEVIPNNSNSIIDQQLLAELLQSLLIFPSAATSSFVKTCLLNCLSNSTESIDHLVNDIRNSSHRMGANPFMIEILEFCRTLQPKNFNIANTLCRIYSDLGSHDKSIAVSLSIYEFCDSLFSKIQASYPLIIAYLTASQPHVPKISGISRELCC
jgi:hypothetical protein